MLHESLETFIFENKTKQCFVFNLAFSQVCSLPCPSFLPVSYFFLFSFFFFHLLLFSPTFSFLIFSFQNLFKSINPLKYFLILDFCLFLFRTHYEVIRIYHSSTDIFSLMYKHFKRKHNISSLYHH